MLTEPNVTGTFWRAARAHPGRPCLTDLDEGVTLTYGELAERVAALAGGLAGAGVDPGDRVALLLRNSTDFVVAFLGLVAAGAVAVPLNTRLQAGEIRHMLEDSGSRLLITDDAFLAAMPVLHDIGRLQIHSVTEDGLAPLAGSPLTSPRPPAPSGLMSLMYTSGTTGPPKAVMLTHRSWEAVSGTATTVLGLRSDDAVLHVAPLTHGAGFLLLPTLAAGGHNIVCASFDPERTLRLLTENRVTGMFLVPSMIRMLLDAAPPGWRAPASFRRLYYAGSPIEPHTLREVTAAFDGRVVQSFAQMEAPMFLTVLDSRDHLRALADPDDPIARSAGRRLAEIAVEVVDAAGTPLPPGQDGEIVARAPQLMSGYWGRDAESATALAGGWLHTGDIGHFDEEGYLFVVDRLKDMIVSGGSNVYAREVEEVLVAVPGVRDAAVVGIPDRLWGEAVTAVLTSANGDRDTEAVLASCRTALPGYRVPKTVHWVDELPRNSYGKVLKRALRQHFSQPRPGAVATGEEQEP